MNSSALRVLVVDAEPQITQALQESLHARGYDVRPADDGESAMEVFRQWQPALVITDLSMPKMGGIALCQAIRSCSDVPIIILSVLGQESFKVQALECGADDYITKPFGMDELIARMRAVVRRMSATSDKRDILEAGDFRVDLVGHRAEFRDEEIHLTPREFELLTFLVRNAGKVLTHKALLAAIWGRTYADQPDVVYMLVRQLRKKIEPNPAAPKYLKTEPWIGYRFETQK
ncbi:MAG: response regulator transcription factor [Candidatus Acidiferrales bacterium]